MKIISSILLVTYSFLLFSCTAKTTVNPVSQNTVIIEDKPALDSPRFDIKRFEINSYKQKIFKENFKKPGFDAQYEEESSNGKHVRQLTIFPEYEKAETQEYVEEISTKWSPFNIQKRYNYLGNLKFWGIYFRNECIKKSYEYDDKGNIINIIDCDKYFKHSFADIREFLLKAKGIDIYDTRQAIARRVNHRNEDPTQVYYDIYILSKEAKDDYRIVIFDDTLEINEYHNEHAIKGSNFQDTKN